eukprot:gene26557-32095_t
MSAERILIQPTSLQEPLTESSPLPKSLMNQWRVEGYAFIDGILPVDLIYQGRQEIEQLVASRPDTVIDDFGGFSFPFKSPSGALNSIVLHPLILSIARQALQSEVTLIQGEAWLKKRTECRPEGNQDQRMHMDFPNHTLLHPPAFDSPEVIAMILYFDDAEECGGETAVVAREGPDDPLYRMPYNKMPGTGQYPWVNDRTTVENYFKEVDPELYAFRQELYKKEKYLNFRKGSLLLYRHDVYHRGTPIKPGHTRIVLNLAYKKSHCTWITCWSRGFAFYAYDQLWGIIPTLSEDQRAALGIPREADVYWSQGSNRENFSARYLNQVPKK